MSISNTNNPPPAPISLSFSNKNLETFDVENDLRLVSSASSSSSSSLHQELQLLEPRQLKSLDLSFNRLNKHLESFLNHPMLAWIESLDLSNNNITSLHGGVIFPPQLRKLDLSHNFLKVSDIGHKIKNSCRFLLSLKLSHNALANSLARGDDNINGDHGNGGIAFPRALASLDISNNGISRFDGVLNGLSRLHTLRAENNELDNVDDDVMEQISTLSRYKQLRYLHLSGNPSLEIATGKKKNDDDDAVAILRNKIISVCCESLRTLDGIPIKGRESFQELPEQEQHRQCANDKNATIIATSSPSRIHHDCYYDESDSSSPARSRNNIKTASSIPFSGESPNSGAAARDERRKCQALREMLQAEMKQEAALKVEVEQLKKQLLQQQSLQRSQVHTMTVLKRDNELSELEIEKLKTEISENSLSFLECHAEMKQQKMMTTISSSPAGDEENVEVV